MLFIVPFKAGSELRTVLKAYEKKNSLHDLVDDFAVSNSSLEEVFIEVTKDEDDVFDISDARSRRSSISVQSFDGEGSSLKDIRDDSEFDEASSEDDDAKF